MGLKLKKLSDFTARFDRDGYKYDPPRIGRETTPQTYVTGPDGFWLELVEDPRLPVPAIGHHLHYWMEDPEAVKKWYVQTLHLEATYRGRVLKLPRQEFQLLKFLAERPGQVFGREQLLSRVWGYRYGGGTRTVDIHVRRLRVKLGQGSAMIETVRNVGYKMRAPGTPIAG
jgi:DNA-binding winged helix-turn-helix (wHTH) protein